MSSCVITNTAAPDIRTFPMLLELLSTDLTSLNQDVDRLAVVIDMIVAQDGSTTCAGIYRALVVAETKAIIQGPANQNQRNHAFAQHSPRFGMAPIQAFGTDGQPIVANDKGGLRRAKQTGFGCYLAKSRYPRCGSVLTSFTCS